MRFKLITMLVFLVFLLAGCGLFGKDQQETMQEIDPPQDVTYLEEGLPVTSEEGTANNVEGTDGGDAAVEEASTYLRELYLIDKNGYVVPQTFELPKVEGVAKQALEYLVANGPVQELLPNGFRAVLPPDTVINGVNMEEDGTLVVDFSKEFTDYAPEDEKRILEALTWTLTQFEQVDKVQIQINGYEQNVMPVNQTPIGESYSRANGINLDSSLVADITNSKAVTVYYLGQNEGSIYYVPVTKRVQANEENLYTAIVSELINGPAYGSGLLTEMNERAKLLSDPSYENGTLTLNFDESIYGSFGESILANSVIDTIALSLIGQMGIEQVSLQVNGSSQDLVGENGQLLTEPVGRPEKINPVSF
ncbi:sporulation protein [Bacillus sp. HMF5848]|nr:GerMN domain-containing protein [Bacillus sp. HMF5848]RSK29400.1 sporulation protein [Bacillus sp. HMF5848]